MNAGKVMLAVWLLTAANMAGGNIAWGNQAAQEKNAEPTGVEASTDASADTGAEAGAEAVRDAQVGLRSGRGYPWYDSAKDDLRRLKVRPPKPPRAPLGWSVSASSFAWLMYVPWVVLALFAALVLYFGLRFMLRREEYDNTEVETVLETVHGDAARLEALPVAAVEAGDLLEQARQHYDSGRFGPAIVYLFSHQLMELDRSQWIRLARGKTNRQYISELRGNSALREMLETTMVVFEEVFFGAHPLERERFEQCWRQLPQFDELVAAQRS